jgi:hypothetical protein
MYPNMFQALGESRIREWHERAARDRLIRQARQARREAAHAAGRRPRLWAGFRPAEPVSAAPADEQAAAMSAAPVDEQAAAMSAAPADEQAAAMSAAQAEERATVSADPVGEQTDRQPVGCRAA